MSLTVSPPIGDSPAAAPAAGTTSTTSVLKCTSILSEAATRSAIAWDAAPNSGPRWSWCTFEAYRVRYVAISQAESPPPTTTSSCSRNIGVAPSQIAHDAMPRPQNSSSDGMRSRRADEPVAMITACVFSVSSGLVTVKGR